MKRGERMWNAGRACGEMRQELCNSDFHVFMMYSSKNMNGKGVKEPRKKVQEDGRVKKRGKI